jgi:cytochrome c55X
MNGNWPRALAGLLGIAFLMQPDAFAAEVSVERAAALRHLLVQDCGSCHGLRLTGGLGPALTPAALADKSPEFLRDVILNGRPGTPMPPWKPFMTESEAAWLVELLQRGVNADAR